MNRKERPFNFGNFDTNFPAGESKLLHNGFTYFGVMTQQANDRPSKMSLVLWFTLLD